MPFQSKFIEEKTLTSASKFPAPLGVDDIERKISNDYLKFFDKIKQQLSNDPYNSSIVKGLPIYCVPIKQNTCILKIVRILQIFSNS